MSKYSCNSVHINAVMLAAVVSGEQPANTPVGELLTTDGEFETLFVHFDKESGAARTSKKGKIRLNARKQTPRPADASAVVSADALSKLTPEQAAQIAAILAG